MSIRVTIFDDNAKRRDGLQLLIEAVDNMECVGVYPDCRDAVKRIEESNPDVVLMDINMPYVDGVAGVAAIKTVYPSLKIVMQTVFEDDEKIFASIRAGADGYLLKQSTPTKLIDAINDVMHGGAPMTPSVARKVIEFFNGSRNAVKTDFQLTQRELEILGLLVKGYSYKMIANECSVTFSTINTHIKKIYEKLQVSSATGAVSKAIKEGIVEQ